ncbi:MAG: site-specific integrase [Oscillospiraceae bacterium]|jgi:integrase|nr:site-specific integrase [Oscillospiraceae bacterium]
MPATKYKTKSGAVKWKTDFWYTDWTGSRRKKKKEGFEKRSDALAFEREFLLKNKRSCDMSFASLVDLYRQDAKHRVRDGTQGTQDSIIDKWLLPYFGELQVNEISAVTIRNWQNTVMAAVNPRTNRKYAATYIRTINSRLSAIFNYAVMFYNLPQNPCKPAGFMGKKKAGKMKFWTVSEFNTAIQFVKKPGFRVALLLLYWTGMRIGECLDLTPSDIFDVKAIHIEKTHHRKEGEDVSGPPKTDNSFRDISMPGFLYDEVQKYISALYGIGQDDRIFYFTHGTLNTELDRIAAASGMKRIRIHDLRHSHAALLVEMGYSIVAVAERLGDTVKVAMETYSHLYPDKMEAIAEDLERQAESGTEEDVTPESNALSNIADRLENVEKEAEKI